MAPLNTGVVFPYARALSHRTVGSLTCMCIGFDFRVNLCVNLKVEFNELGM